MIKLPEEETVAALIVYGYPDGEPAPSKRKDTEEKMRFFINGDSHLVDFVGYLLDFVTCWIWLNANFYK